MNSRISSTAFLLLLLLLMRTHAEDEQTSSLQVGGLNARCRSSKDCRSFGYICWENRTCQCDMRYIPDASRRVCVGGVNQQCVYDEHCIVGAFCMHQAICRCKDSSPMERNEGLVCSAGSLAREDLMLVHIFVVLTLIFYD